MLNIEKIAVIGGDMRQVYMAEGLKNNGFDVTAVGFEKTEKFSESIHKSSKVDLAVKNSDCIVLPLPVTQDKIFVFAPYSENPIILTDLLEAIDSNKTVFGGMISPSRMESMEAKGIKAYDYYKREELIVSNAVPTAEGAIRIAIEEPPFTLNSSHCLISGFGRISKMLARILQGFGADITIAVRKCSDLAWIKSIGAKGINISELKDRADEFDIVFNTVPAVIFDKDVLNRMKKGCLIIDLASYPGGVDFEYAKEIGLNVKWAKSLPGIVAPLTAGNIISDTIINIIKEENEWTK